MRFVVLGAGAIGGTVGARLFQRGYDVTLVARGEHGRALASSGLRLEAPDETVTLPIPVMSEPAQVTWTEDTVVLLGVKGQHTDHALTPSTAAPSSIAVVCMQNGVENERRVLRHFVDTYGMCVMCPATQLQPGVIQVHSAPVSGMLDLGRFPSGLDERGQAIADAIDSTTFQSIARPDIMRWKYRKLLMNLANAVEALSGPAGRFSALAKEAHQEGAAALVAAGIDVASAEEDRERRADNLQMAPTSSGEWQGGSSWQSLARGAGSIEAEFLNGEIALLGRLYGVPTPVNALLERLALAGRGRGAASGHVDRRGPEHGGRGRRMPSERGAALADDFAVANAEVIAFARSCSQDEWADVGGGRGMAGGHCAAPHRRGARAGLALAPGDEQRGGRARHGRGHRPGERRPRPARRVGRARSRPSRCSRFVVVNSRRCCAGSTTSSWIGRPRSARPGDRSFPAPIWRR